MNVQAESIKELVVATQNEGKLKELFQLLPHYQLYTMGQLGFHHDIPEPWSTFQENAKEKALTIFREFGKMTMAEDSGLCIKMLNGDPGVLSARYAGTDKSDFKNNEKVLDKMIGIEDRTAWYEACICLVLQEDNIHFFTDRCLGNIGKEHTGNGGFGYDPIFIPEGLGKSFGELGAEVKNKISHRGKAVKAMAEFLKTI